MANIVLRNGKTLIYNSGTKTLIEEGMIGLYDRRDLLVAYIPIDIIERVEFEKPCKIYRQHKNKR